MGSYIIYYNILYEKNLYYPIRYLTNINSDK